MRTRLAHKMAVAIKQAQLTVLAAILTTISCNLLLWYTVLKGLANTLETIYR